MNDARSQSEGCRGKRLRVLRAKDWSRSDKPLCKMASFLRSELPRRGHVHALTQSHTRKVQGVMQMRQKGQMQINEDVCTGKWKDQIHSCHSWLIHVTRDLFVSFVTHCAFVDLVARHVRLFNKLFVTQSCHTWLIHVIRDSSMSFVIRSVKRYQSILAFAAMVCRNLPPYHPSQHCAALSTLWCDAAVHQGSVLFQLNLSVPL